MTESSRTMLVGLVCLAVGCDGDTAAPNGPDPGDPMTNGMMVYTAKHGVSSFTCNTCHALKEPSEDGTRRVGHMLGDATRRPSYKNGQLTNMLDAVNTCLTDWMNADPWTEATKEWTALHEYLDGMAPAGEAPAVQISVGTPPIDPSGGDADAGRALFNMSCVMCHGQDAGGTLRGPPLAGRALEGDYIARRVRTSGKQDSSVYQGLTGGIMPFWGTDRISESELLDLVAFVSGSEAVEDPPDPPPPVEPPPQMMRECEATHARVGWTTSLSMLFHDVSGQATIVDDCTIEVTQFNFDGNGIDIQMYAGQGGDYVGGFAVSGQLYNFPEGYADATLTLKLPEGRTLDEVDGISVWCVAVGVSFGDGLFAAP